MDCARTGLWSQEQEMLAPQLLPGDAWSDPARLMGGVAGVRPEMVQGHPWWAAVEHWFVPGCASLRSPNPAFLINLSAGIPTSRFILPFWGHFFLHLELPGQMWRPFCWWVGVGLQSWLYINSVWSSSCAYELSGCLRKCFFLHFYCFVLQLMVTTPRLTACQKEIRKVMRLLIKWQISRSDVFLKAQLQMRHSACR